jgi:exopolysaccharide biosynthesis WecB/TagA/CpsF family protein
MIQVNILNLCIDNVSKSELLAKLTSEGGIVFTPNVDHLVKLQTDQDFNEAYKIASYKVCDSQILMYASRFLGNPIQQKISGSDLLPDFYHYHKDNENMKIFLLGGLEGVGRKAQEIINKKVGRDIVVDSHSPSWGFENNPDECLEVVDLINNSGANVLAMGVGSPKQEIWIAKYRNRLKNIKIFLAVGAAIDFEGGNQKRAPQWMSNLGLEWFYRLSREPQRLWKRYLVEDISFFWLLLKQKLNLYQAPFNQSKGYSKECHETTA